MLWGLGVTNKIRFHTNLACNSRHTKDTKDIFKCSNEIAGQCVLEQGYQTSIYRKATFQRKHDFQRPLFI
jgi:hypothetical protein